MMDERLKKLMEWGCDVKYGLDLAMGNEKLFFECLGDITQDESFYQLKEALQARDAAAAFAAAHSLKGLFANLGLTPMFNKSLEIVEPLRAGRCENLLLIADELIAMNQRLLDILNA